MTDIVERLLWDAAHQRSDSETERLEREAADEIEQLKKELRAARAQRHDDSILIAHFQLELREARAEIERLRELCDYGKTLSIMQPSSGNAS
jgi:predicted RNase H-like nuclease (RuvC/YqgF family)